jgi:hypothetical protein
MNRNKTTSMNIMAMSGDSGAATAVVLFGFWPVALHAFRRKTGNEIRNAKQVSYYGLWGETMTGGIFNKTRVFVVFSAGILLLGQSVFALPLSSDPAAMPAYRGSTPFASLDGMLSGYVDYAVYAKGSYDGLDLYENMFSDSFVYAYQVFNSDNSKVAIDYFSIGLFADVQPPLNAAYDSTKGVVATAGSIPGMQLILPQSVIYLFQTDNVGAGEHSLTLLFASDTAPGMVKGAVSGGVTGGAIMDLPTPSNLGWVVPEPATFGLLIGGGFLAIRRRQEC